MLGAAIYRPLFFRALLPEDVSRTLSDWLPWFIILIQVSNEASNILFTFYSWG